MRASGGIRIAGRVVLWIVSALVTVSIGVAGVGKLTGAGHWHDLFLEWGYPGWFVPIVGVFEVVGAVMLVIPRTARYGAALLAIVMASALITLLTHPGGPLGWGRTPLIDLAMIAGVGIARMREHAALTATRRSGTLS